MSQAVGSVDKLRIVPGHLGADGAGGDGVGLRSPHGAHLTVGDGDGETARIRTVERAHAGFLNAHGAATDRWGGLRPNLRASAGTPGLSGIAEGLERVGDL